MQTLYTALITVWSTEVLEYRLDPQMKQPQIEDLHFQKNRSKNRQLWVTLVVDPDIILQPCTAPRLPLLPPSMWPKRPHSAGKHLLCASGATCTSSICPCSSALMPGVIPSFPELNLWKDRHVLHFKSDQALEVVTQRGCGITTIFGDTQN